MVLIGSISSAKGYGVAFIISLCPRGMRHGVAFALLRSVWSGGQDFELVHVFPSFVGHNGFNGLVMSTALPPSSSLAFSSVFLSFVKTFLSETRLTSCFLIV